MNPLLTPDPPSVLVVRLATSCYHDGRGITQKRTLRFLRRRSTGHNFLEEDAGILGADEVLSRVVDLPSCKDGTYVVKFCNVRRDYESGDLIDYDYKLIPT